MINIRPYEQLGHANHGWLDSRHHFSFASYYNPKRMNFGALRVINDDIIKAGAGFDMHPHDNMEIITFVRKGAITHKDDKGNQGRTQAGNIQVMSAGTGIHHAEYNLESDDTQIYQIWIKPKKPDVKPSWNAHEFPKETTDGKLALMVSGQQNAPLTIHQDADIYAGKLNKDMVISHPIKNQAYLLVSDGAIDLDGHKVKKGDGAEIIDQNTAQITALENAEILVIDVPAYP